MRLSHSYRPSLSICSFFAVCSFAPLSRSAKHHLPPQNHTGLFVRVAITFLSRNHPIGYVLFHPVSQICSSSAPFVILLVVDCVSLLHHTDWSAIQLAGQPYKNLLVGLFSVLPRNNLFIVRSSHACC
ncbi:hypothetical protein GQ42DRAFT_14636 [Ramicandelaber brevisporus]|nr:hypothetical protein GQ42DRAFT_14636 [Ramicandelaber brevisporus]